MTPGAPSGPARPRSEVTYIPGRLNEQPVVVPGLTDGELRHVALAALAVLVPLGTAGAQDLPGPEGVDFAREFNGWVAKEVVGAHPDRFRAFATLPVRQPAAADELERAAGEHGFVGCMSYGAIGGRFLDHADFAPVLARADALGVPIYIHPDLPSRDAMAVYYDGLGDELAGRILGGPG